MFGLFKKRETVESFWNWFQENEQGFRDFQLNPAKVLEQLFDKGDKIQKGLAFELEPTMDGGTINMTISANGIINHFALVQEMIAKAPIIEGWHFIAFRQRITMEMAAAMRLKYNGLELSPNEMMFLPIIAEGELKLLIFAEGITIENYTQMVHGGMLIVEHILGELDCVAKVKSYEFYEMPNTHDEFAMLLPLLGLATFVDDFYTNRS